MHRVNKITDSVKAWKAMPEIPKDPIFTFNQMYAKDSKPQKVNLSIGAYTDDSGKAWVLPSVKMAVDKIFENNQFNCSYLPLTGDPEFTEESVKLAYAYNPKTQLLFDKIPLNKVARTQTLSGTGGIYMALTFAQNMHENFNGTIWVPNATWPIHNTMAKLMGYNVQQYHYYDIENRKFDFEEYFQSLTKIPEKAFVVFHCSGHNPTGFDPSIEQWQRIAKLVADRQFLVLMDNAYQGFVSGDIERDGYPIKVFAEHGVPMMVVQSFAKNIGLYGQRTGCLSIVMESEEEAAKVQAYFGYRNRNVFSNPPRFGSDIAKIVLKNPEVNAQWRKDIVTMADSINERRRMFIKELETLKCADSWRYLLEQKGMFAFTHLKVPHIRALREKFAVYMTEDGRMSITGMNAKNVGYVAKAVAEITKS